MLCVEFPQVQYIHLSDIVPGGYFRNFLVGMCCWDPGTLSLYQSSFKGILLPYTRLNSQNPPTHPRVVFFQKLLRSQAQSSQNKTKFIFSYFEWPFLVFLV